MPTITISKSKVEKKKGVVVISLADYEAIKEELDMFRSKRLANDIKKSRAEIKKGKTITLAEAKRRLKPA